MTRLVRPQIELFGKHSPKALRQKSVTNKIFVYSQRPTGSLTFPATFQQKEKKLIARKCNRRFSKQSSNR